MFCDGLGIYLAIKLHLNLKLSKEIHFIILLNICNKLPPLLPGCKYPRWRHFAPFLAPSPPHSGTPAAPGRRCGGQCWCWWGWTGGTCGPPSAGCRTARPPCRGALGANKLLGTFILHVYYVLLFMYSVKYPII